MPSSCSLRPGFRLAFGGKGGRDLRAEQHVEQLAGQGGVVDGGVTVTGVPASARYCQDRGMPLVHGLAVDRRPFRDH